MKKIILLGCTICTFYSQAELIVTKKDGGLFGYKTVTEVSGEGRHTLTCTNPGKTRCKAQMLTVDGSLTLTSEEFDAIDATVTKFVTENRKESGSFNYSSKCLITFNYNPDNHTLVYTIYSMDEAQKLYIR